ncbi:sensor histidine kinase [Chitinolyticbacter albus]|uniref:sensor histidine kinase n=1 Tax=Chitinolyticbacter albus TaxID=2961951 RepID=UPI00210EF68C|nr:histidine kinase [Chitinolyticbacter albus]
MQTTTSALPGILGNFSLRTCLISTLLAALCTAMAWWYFDARLWAASFVLLLGAWLTTGLVLSALRAWAGPDPGLLPVGLVVLTVNLLGAGLAATAHQTMVQDEAVRQWPFTYTFWAAALAGWLWLLPGLWRSQRVAVEAKQQQQALAQARVERLLAEAELRTLQAQVEPHFLYNTLANARYLTRHDPERAGMMLDHLIAYLRTSLPDLRGPVSTVARELRLAEHYLAIMAIRMGERLSYHVTAPERLLTHSMPPLMLVTLVENAVKHGIEPKAGCGCIAIGISQEDGMLTVEVCDDGMGIGEPLGSGLGLVNIHQRLATLYGGRATLSLSPSPGGGTQARIHLPLEHSA